MKVNAPFVYENPQESYTIAKIIYEASVKNKYDIGIAMSLRKIALYHSEILKDYNKALSFNDKGYEISKKMNNDTLMLFFNFNKGALYGKLGFLKRGITILDACLLQTNIIKNAKKRGLMRGDMYTHKALFLSNLTPSQPKKVVLNNYINAMNEYEKALDICLDAGYTNVGYCYSDLGDYNKAAYYFNKAIKFYKLKNILTCEVEYTNLANLHFKTGNYQKSLSYSDSSNAICLKMKPRNYSLISENYKNYKNVYQKLDSTEVVTKYYNLELLYKDSLNLEKENQLGESAKYIIDKNELENSELIKDNYYLITGFVVLLLVFGFGTFLYFKNRSNQHNKQTLLNEEQLENKSSEIVELKHKVSSSYNDLIDMAKKNDPLFIAFFIELYPEFYKNLKSIQPNLTLVEQKVCFYLKLKFTTKEIAEYTFVSVKAIQNRKNRLRKRLNIENDIYDWMDTV
jgi:hypothetical protein